MAKPKFGEKACPKCAEHIKLEAKVCRFCGHEFGESDIQAAKTEGRDNLKNAGIGCAALFALMVVGGALIGGHGGTSVSDNSTSSEEAGASNSAAADPHEAAKELQAKTAMAAGITLKNSARNPDSLVIESGLASDDGTLLCVRYRAQNGFGGMNRESIAFLNRVPHDSSSFWNKHCAHRELNDVTEDVKLGTTMGS